MMRLLAAGGRPRSDDDRYGVRCDDVHQYLSWPYRRQLIGISDEQQRGSFGQGTGEGPHQRHIDHRGLVDDEQIAVEGCLVSTAKSASPRICFEQSVDGLRFEASAFGQSPCSATCRGTERNGHVFREKYLEDRVYKRRLADAGPSGNYQHLRTNRN